MMGSGPRALLSIRLGSGWDRSSNAGFLAGLRAIGSSVCASFGGSFNLMLGLWSLSLGVSDSFLPFTRTGWSDTSDLFESFITARGCFKCTSFPRFSFSEKNHM